MTQDYRCFKDFAVSTLVLCYDAIRREVPGVRTGEDTEHLRRMRVRSRRMRSALELFGAAVKLKPDFAKAVRGITKGLGCARDLDMQIKWLGEFSAENGTPGTDRLMLRLTQARAAYDTPLIKLMDEIDSGLPGDGRLHRMSLRVCKLPPDDWAKGTRRCVYKKLVLMVANMISYAPYLDTSGAIKEHHAMRIAAKQLRYGMEFSNAAYGGELKKYVSCIKKMQSALGDVQDSFVRTELVDNFLVDEKRRTVEYMGHCDEFSTFLPGVEAIRSHMEQIGSDGLESARAHWGRFQEDGVWPALMDELKQGIM